MATVIEAATLADFGDRMCEAYARLQGNLTAALGLGTSAETWGVTKALATLATDFTAGSIPETAADCNRVILNRKVKDRAQAVFKLLTDDVYRQVESHVRTRSSDDGAARATIDAYLKFLNVDDTAKWQCLFDGPLYRLVHYAIYGSYPGVYNCYTEILSNAGTADSEANTLNHLYRYGMGKVTQTGGVTSALTKAAVYGELITNGTGGAKIDVTKSCGGYPYAVITNYTSGSGNLTLTGYWYDPATEAISALGTSITNVTGNSSGLALVKGGGTMPTDGLLLEVTGVALGAGLDGATVYIETRRPSGRPLCK